MWYVGHRFEFEEGATARSAALTTRSMMMVRIRTHVNSLVETYGTELQNGNRSLGLAFLCVCVGRRPPSYW
jgi:hypothetical protein